MPDKAIYDAEDPLWVNFALKPIQHVVIPNKLAARWRERPGVGPHLRLKGQSHVVRVAEVEVAGKVNILKDLQVPAS